MHYLSVVLILGVVTAGYAAIWSPEDHDTAVGDVISRDGFLRLTGAPVPVTDTDLATATMRSMAYVFDHKNNDAPVATGIVINKLWVVTTKAAVESFSTATDLSVAVDITSSNSIGVVRSVKEKKENPDCTLTIGCIALLRVCPSLPDASAYNAVLAPLTNAFQATTVTVKLLMHIVSGTTHPLNFVVKHVGERCECEAYPAYATDKHVCLTDDVVHAEVGDLKGLVVVTADMSAVIGFLVKEQTGTDGELVYLLSDSQAFITDTAKIAPYEY